MTREETKEILEEVKAFNDSIFQYNQDYMDALEIAIKALEQEPKENDRVKNELNRVKTELELCEDCISRQAAIDILKNTCSVISPLSDDVILIDKAEAMAKLVFLPTVTPEQKTDVLDKIKAEITEYSSLWVEYKIIGHTDRDIENIIEDVLIQARDQVLEIIDKYRQEG